MRCMFTTVAAALHDPATLRPLVEPFEALLREAGAIPLPPGQEAEAEPLVVLVATGGTERAVLDLHEQRPGRPLLLLAHPGHNSLPAALEALARIHQLGGRGRVTYVAGPEDSEGRTELADGLHDLVVAARLRSARIGLIGAPSDWLVASSPDPRLVQRVWGPAVDTIHLDSLYARLPPAPRPSADADAGTGAVAIAPAARAEADRLHAALRDLVVEGRYDAVSVRCFDLIGELGTTGCVALSRLNDVGVVAGCEGDLVSTVGILWLRELVSALPWMANPARMSRAASTLTLAHCTVPLSLVSSHRLDTHFESGRGVAIAGRFEPGPVTLARIGGAGLDRLWACDATLLTTGDDPSLCRTQVTVRLPDDALADLLEAPLGNHVLVVRGHHAAAAWRWWETFVGRR
jgi:L-fucose isomerase-like protein